MVSGHENTLGTTSNLEAPCNLFFKVIFTLALTTSNKQFLSAFALLLCLCLRHGKGRLYCTLSDVKTEKVCGGELGNEVEDSSP